MTAANLKILYVITHLPCPPTMGVHHRILNIGRQLKKCGGVTVVYVAKSIEPQRLAETQRQFDRVIVMKSATTGGHDTWVRFKTKFDFHWPWHYANRVSRKDRELFKKLHRQHDITWFHTLPAADGFSLGGFDKSVMDIDDLNHIKYQMWAQQAGAGLRRRTAGKFLVCKWKRRESQALKRFSMLTVCSEQDKHFFGDDDSVAVIPNGFAQPDSKPTWIKRRNMRLGFIGNISYAPNKEGLIWFGKEVWPKIIAQCPRAKLRIVGHKPTDAAFLDRPGFEPLGFIEDPSDEFNTWSAMIVPLRFGGGTRLKIIEAFSRMCPVVSTPAGAYGIRAIEDKHILLKDDPAQFARGCITLMKDDERGKSLALAGWELFVENYTWDVIGEQIARTVQSCAGENRK